LAFELLQDKIQGHGEFTISVILYFKRRFNMENLVANLETLVRETHKSETEVMALALQAGLRQLVRELILGRYLRGGISRGETIEAVGIDWVELAEKQRDAVMEDLAWATKK
jgi:hypothetical protein